VIQKRMWESESDSFRKHNRLCKTRHLAAGSVIEGMSAAGMRNDSYHIRREIANAVGDVAMEDRVEGEGRSPAEDAPVDDTPAEDAPDVAGNFKPGIKFKLAAS